MKKGLANRSVGLDRLLRGLTDLKVYSSEELKELFKTYHKYRDNENHTEQEKIEGLKAFDLIVLHNLKLVVSIAPTYQHLGSELEDLINEGTIGLMTAVEKFDINNGGKFSTYSALWIKNSMRRMLSTKGRAIRIPHHLSIHVGKILNFVSNFKSEVGRRPSISEIKAEVNLPKDALNSLLNNGVLSVDSLNKPLSDGKGVDFKSKIDVLEDEDAPMPSYNAENSDDMGHLIDHVNLLPAREKIIISRRFGLSDGIGQTLEEVADNFGITKERVRQIQLTAIRRLRNTMSETYQKNLLLPKEWR